MELDHGEHHEGMETHQAYIATPGPPPHYYTSAPPSSGDGEFPQFHHLLTTTDPHHYNIHRADVLPATAYTIQAAENHDPWPANSKHQNNPLKIKKDKKEKSTRETGRPPHMHYLVNAFLRVGIKIYAVSVRAKLPTNSILFHFISVMLRAPIFFALYI